MKKLMLVVVAGLFCAAFADGKDGAARPEGARRVGAPISGPMMRSAMDPVVRMVSNPAVAEKLGLNDEQKDKIKKLREDFKKNRDGQKKLRDATMKQVELMKAEKIDEAAVMAVIDEIFELRKTMAKDQVKRIIAVKLILTPEQLAKAQEEMKVLSASRGERRPGVRRDKAAPQPEVK